MEMEVEQLNRSSRSGAVDPKVTPALATATDENQFRRGNVTGVVETPERTHSGKTGVKKMACRLDCLGLQIRMLAPTIPPRPHFSPIIGVLEPYNVSGCAVRKSSQVTNRSRPTIEASILRG